MTKPNTLFNVAARSAAPKLRRYEATARGSVSTRTKSSQPIVAVLATSAASGMSTIALRKNVENPERQAEARQHRRRTERPAVHGLATP